MSGNLSAVDSKNKIDALLDEYLQPISGPVLITAANTINGAGKVAQAKPLGEQPVTVPAGKTADANLAKSFPVFGEARKLTFRLELFNAFNHPNYRLPDANISNINTVATISGTVKPMRQAQFAVRFDF